MSLRTRLTAASKALFGPAPVRGDAGAAAFAALAGAGVFSSPGYLASDAQRQIAQYSGWVRTCVRFLARHVGQVPAAARRTDFGDRKSYQKSVAEWRAKGHGRPARRHFVPHAARAKSAVGGRLTPEDELEYLDDGDPLTRLLRDPNGPQTGVQFWPLCAVYRYLTGRCYVWMATREVGDGGVPQALWAFPSHWVTPKARPGSGNLVDWYEVRSNSGTGTTPLDVPADEMLEWGDWHPAHPLLPDSVVAGMARAVDTHVMLELARYRGLQQGADVGGVLEPPADANLGDPALTRFLAEFQASAWGVFNSNKPLMLPPGWKYTPRDAAKELAYNESLDHTRRDVMAHFGLDEVLMGYSNESTYAAASVADGRLKFGLVRPEQRSLAGVLTERLARRFGDDYVVLFPDDGGFEDPDQKRQNYQVGWQCKAVTPNEVRVNLLGLEPSDDPGADELGGPEPAPNPGGGGGPSHAGGGAAEPGAGEDAPPDATPFADLFKPDAAGGVP